MYKRTAHYGFTLLDSVLSLAVIAIMVILYAGVVNVREVNRRVAFRAEAAAIADEEITALRQRDVGTLANQSNGNFIGVLSNAGRWQIASDPANLDTTSSPCPPATNGKHCGANVLDVAGSSGFSGQPSARLLFPSGAYSTATLQADWQVMSDSPNGWAIGYWFQASDKNNGYRLRLAASSTDLDSTSGGTQNIVVEKVSGGTVSILWSSITPSFSTGTWNNLKIALDPAASATIKVYLNGTQQDGGTIGDTTFKAGAAALYGWGGVHAEVDDVQTVTSSSSSWTFEGSSRLPTAWIRLSLNDLPDSTANVLDDNGVLTLTSYPNTNSTTLKQAVITVSWRGAAGTAKYSTTALIGKSGVGL